MARWLTLFAVLATGSLSISIEAQAQQPAADKQKTDNKAAGRVIAAITKAVGDNAAAAKPLKGDALTEALVRAAAAAADKEDESVKTDAFLTGVGVGLDRGNFLAENFVTRRTFSGIEPAADAAKRKEAIRDITMREHTDWTQHWACSLGMTGRLGAETSESFGLLKEQKDLLGPSGWSWKDINANSSAIEFGSRVKSGEIKLETVAKKFSIVSVLPDPKSLPDDLNKEAFAKDFGTVGSEKALKLHGEIKASAKSHIDTHWKETAKK